MSVSRIIVCERVAATRQWMSENDVNAIVIANSDPHTNEYVAERWMGREWLSSFHGSNGTVVVTADKAGLWTDSRYFLLAEAALEGTGIDLFKMGEKEVPTIEKWLATELSKGEKVSVMGGEMPLLTIEKLSKSLDDKGIKIVDDLDFLEAVWTDRPAEPVGEIYLVPTEYTGASVSEKIAQVREKMVEKELDAYLLGRTDESNWLFNFKGTDIKACVTPYCYTLVTAETTEFFIDPRKLTSEVKASLEEQGVTLCDYGAINDRVAQFTDSDRLLIVESYLNYSLYQSLKHADVKRDRAIVTDLKARKNSTEMTHLRGCMIRDGAAIVKSYVWIYDQLAKGAPLSEWKVNLKLEEMRALQDDFAHVSFMSIVGYNGNGALNHYSVTEEKDYEIKADGVLLLDSGGVFMSGTTDTTRVIPMGNIHANHRKDYTLVLKCLVQLMRTKFPRGTSCAQLDGICRAHMWQHNRSFKHGTGHGVGFGLEVHEGPQNISPRGAELMELEMLTTIEPGIYNPGEYGIRLENMVYTIEAESNEFDDFYEFENITFCPFSPELIDLDLLTDDELAWLNDYHKQVLEKLTPELEPNEVEWLKNECREITR